mgnify:FL=1|tara:strand:- start:1939 stop:2379 length:441 start_codon:yes stop_codon:yes gene_type:complete
MRITAEDLKEINLLKYYRVVRKWACNQNDIKDADLELLIYLSCLNRFTRDDFINGVYAYSWDKKRWDRLRDQGWIDVWRHRNRTTIKYSIFKTSYKCNVLINRVYKILLGEEDIPMTASNKYYNNDSYTDKVMNKVIDDMIKDPNR